MATDSVVAHKSPRPIVYLVVGAQGCGKTTFLQKLTRTDPSKLHPPHIPFIITNKNPRAQGRSPELHFYEDQLPWTPDDDYGNKIVSNDMYGNIDLEDGELGISRQKRYGPDVIIICFDISSKSQLDFIPHLIASLESNYQTSHIPPLLLLGLKRDIRSSTPCLDERNPTFILPTEGLGLAQKLALTRYLECSSLSGEFLQEVSEDIVDEGIKRRMNEISGREGSGTMMGSMDGGEGEMGGLANCVLI